MKNAILRKKLMARILRLKTNKYFGALLFLIGSIGVFCIFYQIFSYEENIRPYLIELPKEILEKYPESLPLAKNFTTNTISGLNSLSFFTNLSNLFVSVYLLLLAVTILGLKRTKKIAFNPYVQSVLTLYILITGIVYCFILRPFIHFENLVWMKGVKSLNLSVNISLFQHIFVPLFMLFLFFIPFSQRKIDKSFLSLGLVFPSAYLVFSLLRGFLGEKQLFSIENGVKVYERWFPYPFMQPKLIGKYFLNKSDFQLLLLFITFILSILFIALIIGIMLRMIRNNQLKRLSI